MGILDKKTRILDVTLTDRGRELLSKNQLKFSYYAFSDEGIDYSGSLAAAKIRSASFDDYVHKNFQIETFQQKRKGLKSYLYTFNSSQKDIPELTVNKSGSLELSRYYEVDNGIFENRVTRRAEDYIAAVVKYTTESPSERSRAEDYVGEQFLNKTNNQILSGNNIIGSFLTKDLLLVTESEVLDISSGKVYGIEEIQADSEVFNKNSSVLSINKEVEIIKALDEVTIEAFLKTSEGKDKGQGFLLEVYESGSFGLKKLNRNDTVDLLTGEVVEEGFSRYADIKVDDQ